MVIPGSKWLSRGQYLRRAKPTQDKSSGLLPWIPLTYVDCALGRFSWCRVLSGQTQPMTSARHRRGPLENGDSMSGRSIQLRFPSGMRRSP